MSHQQRERGWSPKAFLKHLNERHPDTVRFLAKYATGNLDTTSAELIAVENDRLIFRCHTPQGSADGHLSLTAPVTSRADLLAQLTDLLVAARVTDSSQPPTSLEVHVSEKQSHPHLR